MGSIRKYCWLATHSPRPHPILFIRGELSPYIQDSYRDEIARQFPQARAHVVAGTGHWVHAEKPDSVLRAIHRFIDEESDEDSTGEK